MEPKWDIRLGVVLVLLQVLCSGSAESPPCFSGFTEDLFHFTVHRRHLSRGTRLGTVAFNDCSGRTRILFDTDDKRFRVDSDGTLKLKRGLTFHDDHMMFSVHAWDSMGKKHTAFVKVEHQRRVGHHHRGQEDDWPIDPVQAGLHSELLVLEFPKSDGVRRRKREWVIPPIRISEEDRKGPYPKTIAQIKSSHAKETKMVYSISGEGADLPPVGLFSINRNNGSLSVSRPLDRETKDSYLLQAHAHSSTDNIKEPPMEVIIEVLDQNDNHPIFTQNPFTGSVPEASQLGYEFMSISATDADDPNTINADIRYSIERQIPDQPHPNMFEINPLTGAIRVNADGLDREKYSTYTLDVRAADMEGKGLFVMGQAIITVTDSNDNAPQFEKPSYNVSAPENKVGITVLKLMVTDEDEPQSSAWAAKFKIVSGNNGDFFSIATGVNKQEGIITTAKALDYETNSKYTLLVSVENEVPFARAVPTATATVTVYVVDENEAPVFDPVEKVISKPENIPVGEDLTIYTATDPDTAKSQKVTYRMGNDPAGWLSIDADTGLIKVRSLMDREASESLVKDGKYKVLILAVDNDPLPATGTGTLIINLEDVNDNAPVIEERDFKICSRDSSPILLSVTDKDGPQHSAPFNVDLQGDSKNNWTAKMNDSKTGIILSLKMPLEEGTYTVAMRVFDNVANSQINTVQALVCDCSGPDVTCKGKVAGFGLPGVLGILGAILALLLLVLLLLLFLRRKNTKKDPPLISDNDIRDNVYYYDEEGGGEDDQDYDLSVLHRGLDNRPDVFRNDVAPTFLPAPQYRPRPANPEEIATFIDDNLKAADDDPTAPPYDSLLVFDYEGGGSEAGSLSSLNSSSSGDQDYDRLSEWGPRFKKLADMYGGGED